MRLKTNRICLPSLLSNLRILSPKLSKKSGQSERTLRKSLRKFKNKQKRSGSSKLKITEVNTKKLIMPTRLDWSTLMRYSSTAKPATSAGTWSSAAANSSTAWTLPPEKGLTSSHRFALSNKTGSIVTCVCPTPCQSARLMVRLAATTAPSLPSPLSRFSSASSSSSPPSWASDATAPSSRKFGNQKATPTTNSGRIKPKSPAASRRHHTRKYDRQIRVGPYLII